MTHEFNEDLRLPAGIAAEHMVTTLNGGDVESVDPSVETTHDQASDSVVIPHDQEPVGREYVTRYVLLDLKHPGVPYGGRKPVLAVVIGYSAKEQKYYVQGVVPAPGELDDSGNEIPEHPFTIKLSREEVKAAFLELEREREVWLAKRLAETSSKSSDVE